MPAPWSHSALLPVRFFLRELAPTLTAEKELARLSADQRARVLTDAVREFAGKLPATFDAGDAAPLVLAALDAGQCLVIFDGLDEVAPDRRQIAREAVEAFARRCADNRFLVTCRIRSYQNEARLGSFDEVTLAKFDGKKIRDFVSAWYTARADLGQMTRDLADQRADDLRQAVADQKLQELAETPLLLTTMAVVHTAQVTLPRERAVLYLRCVEILLRRWHKHKSGELALLQELGLSEQELLKALAAVALDAHQRGKKGEVADLPKKDVLAILSKRLGSYANAEHFLEHVEDRAGLLLGHGGVDADEPVYSFPHRTFQEFLAGYHLALSDTDFGKQLRARLSERDKWALAAQLGAEHLLYNAGDSPKVLFALGKLCPVSPLRDDNDWRGIVWAGNIAAKMGAERIQREDADNPDGGAKLIERLAQRLLEIIERGTLGVSVLERVDAGNALAVLGDPRDFDEMVDVPAGEFLYGDEKKKKRIAKPFRIGKYPVTNAQYKKFVDATNAPVPFRDDYDWAKPYNWDQKTKMYPEGRANHPVVLVSWNDAQAYCQWARKRLPTEEEWERAARHTDGREYPWVGEFDAAKCNSSESGIGTTTPVGIYLDGASVCGALDMSGNVWEWTASDFDKNTKVLRGGAWGSNVDGARCAVRNWYDAGTRISNVGFRLAEFVTP
jgi:formylglycine-generating enzyme required for sulfatase activity